jgi:acyl-CoA synthetase (AMP-forming)/AMP-acid ligase II
MTFGALGTAADALSTWLARHGYGAGDRIALMMPNAPALVASTFAVWGIGGVAVPIVTRSTATEAAQLLTHSRAAAILCDETRVEAAREAAKSAGIAAYVAGADLSARPRVLRRASGRRAAAPRAPRPTDLATIAYTSGTTGAPKGVMVSHANLLWATLACGQARGDLPDGVGACISPLTHTPVFVSHLLCRLLAGASAVLLEKFDLGVLLECVARHGVTDLPLIGGMVFDVVFKKSQERIAKIPIFHHPPGKTLPPASYPHDQDILLVVTDAAQPLEGTPQHGAFQEKKKQTEHSEDDENLTRIICNFEEIEDSEGTTKRQEVRPDDQERLLAVGCAPHRHIDFSKIINKKKKGN